MGKFFDLISITRNRSIKPYNSICMEELSSWNFFLLVYVNHSVHKISTDSVPTATWFEENSSLQTHTRIILIRNSISSDLCWIKDPINFFCFQYNRRWFQKKLVYRIDVNLIRRNIKIGIYWPGRKSSSIDWPVLNRVTVKVFLSFTQNHIEFKTGYFQLELYCTE